MSEETTDTTAAIEQTETTAEVVETAAVETTEVVETPEPEVQPDPWFKTHGWENEDQAKQEIESLRGLKEKEQRINSWMDEAENPIAEELKTINAFVKQTGIKDLATVSQVMTVTSDSAVKDPISVIALQMRVQNPSKFEALGGAEGVAEALREKYNLPSEGEYTPTKLLIGEAIDALSEIEKIKNNVKIEDNVFTFAEQKKLESQQTLEKRSNQTVGELEKFTKSLSKVEYKYGEKSLPLTVSKDEISQLLETSKSIAHLIDTSTKEGAEGLKQWAQDQLLLKKLKSGEVGLEIEKSVRAESAKAATQEVHNGQVKTVDRGGATTTGEKKLSPIAQSVQDRGLKLPENYQP